ncbi:hypothetical protein HDU67_009096 [Dinochytrium kinnereticum]|nr:hypothetical protein HDU67_009096 [Dinochytrium kinnereticum]
MFNTQSNVIPTTYTSDPRKDFEMMPAFNSSLHQWSTIPKPAGSSAYMANIPVDFDSFLAPSMSPLPMQPTHVDYNSPFIPWINYMSANTENQTLSGTESTASFLEQLFSLPPTDPSTFSLDGLLLPETAPFECIKVEQSSPFSSPGTPSLVPDSTPQLFSSACSTPSMKPARYSPYPTEIKKSPARRGRKPNPNTVVEVIPPPPPTLPPNTFGFINIVFDPITDDLPEDGIPEFKEVHDEANPVVGDDEIHPARAPLLTGIPVPQPTKIVYTVFPRLSQRMVKEKARGI